MADEDFFFLSYGDLINDEDEVILDYLKKMIEKGNPWPHYFNPDVDVFNKNPEEEFDCKLPTFVFVKSRTENCGKSDGCESGCWRVIGRDKLIISEETNKILKFCRKKKPREYKRSWVMEEYKLPKKWNWKEDKVICKIWFMCETEISFWLAKHFTYRCLDSSIVAFNVFPVEISSKTT